MSTKKFFSLILAIIMALTVTLSFSAMNFTGKISTIGTDLRYIEESDAILLAEEIIQTRKDLPDCPWTNETIIHEKVSLFDIDENVNGYIFRLSTNGKETGYIQVDTYAEAPRVIAFGYDGIPALDSMLSYQKQIITKAKSEDKIIYFGAYDYLKKTEKEKSPTYQEISTGKILDNNKMELKKRYTDHRVSTNDTYAKDRLNRLKNSLLTRKSTTESQNQIIYEYIDVPGLWDGFGFVPYTMNEFAGYDNHCAPTCGMNILKYWRDCRGVPNIILGNHHLIAFDSLRREMNHSSTNGTNPYSAYTGIYDYLNNNGLTRFNYLEYRGKQVNNTFDWTWIITQIRHGYPLYIGTTGYPSANSASHAVFGIGYQDCSDGKWIRVADGWDRSISHFLYYTGVYDKDAWYVGWKV